MSLQHSLALCSTSLTPSTSRAGKSTFVTTLSDRAFYGKRRGRIFVNGKEDSLSKHNRLVGFVPQEDIMTRTTTVEETIYFAARTKLPWRTSRAECSRITQRIIKDLGLRDIKGSQIGDEEKRGVSGGQRKRVNIALELVNNPRVLFLDEPTSGKLLLSLSRRPSENPDIIDIA